MQDKTPKNEPGQSLVEFAISLVMLLVLLTVAVDAARALFTYLSMRDAAQESAAYASYEPTDATGTIERACTASNLMSDLCGNTSACVDSGSKTVCNVLEFPDPVLTGSVACMGTSPGGEANGITIDIQYPHFPLAMPLVGTFLGKQDVPIGVQVTDTILTPPCP